MVPPSPQVRLWSFISYHFRKPNFTYKYNHYTKHYHSYATTTSTIGTSIVAFRSITSLLIYRMQYYTNTTTSTTAIAQQHLPGCHYYTFILLAYYMQYYTSARKQKRNLLNEARTGNKQLLRKEQQTQCLSKRKTNLFKLQQTLSIARPTIISKLHRLSLWSYSLFREFIIGQLLSGSMTKSY